MGPIWQIELLGWLRATSGEKVVTRFRTRKAGALLAYLAYFCHRSHPRDALVEILWPEADPDAGRHRLRMALSSLRHQMEPPDVPPGSVILADRHCVQLNPVAITTDVAAFEAALNTVEAADTPATRVQRLRQAVECYRGALLPGGDEFWILAERERLAEAHLGALRRLVHDCEQDADFLAALQWARRMVSADPLREEAHREVIRLLAAGGEPEAALQQYRSLEQLLAEELGERPEAETRALVGEVAASSTGVLPVLAPAPIQAREAFPPRQATVQATGHLPLQLTRFFGRQGEIDHLQEILLAEGARLVTLTGPGGSGKTRLSLAVADRLRTAFQDAVWFVSLVDLMEPHLIADKIKDVLRLPRSPHRESFEQVAAALARQRCLLLLDNLEHLLPAGADLAAALLETAPTLTLLATSRRRLDLPGEREFPVAPLPAPEEPVPDSAIDQAERGSRVPARSAGGACRVPGQGDPHAAPGTRHPAPLISYPSVQLFIDRAQSARPDFQITPRNTAAIAAICRRLEGLPLAIELAAARAWVLTPAQMVERLGQRFELLTRRQDRSDPRHASLRATLDWSYDLLAPELQRFFRRLSCFRGGWTLEAAEAVCAEPGAMGYLEELRESSLVLAEEQGEAMRFRMLETLREHGAERLTLGERQEAAQLHLAYFLGLAEEAESELGGPDQVAWMNRLEREHDNLRVALNVAREENQEAGLRLAGALGPFWERRGYLREGRERLADGLAAGSDAVTAAARAKALRWAGRLAHTQGDYPMARQLYEQSLAIRRELGDQRGIAWNLFLLGLVINLQGEYPTARSLMEAGLAGLRDVEDPAGIGEALNGLSNLASQQGELEKARALAEEALAIHRGRGDVANIAWSLHILGNTALRQGDLGTANSFLEESLDLARQAFFKIMTYTLSSLGAVRLAMGDTESALRLHQESLILRRDSGDKRGCAEGIEGVAAVAAATGNPGRAARLCAAAEALRERIGAPLIPVAHGNSERLISATRAALGEAAFAAAWNAGRATTLEQATELALERPADNTTTAENP